ncbi:MAG TPA: RNA polymerase sigma factor [Ktedonobacterales bacterium]|nr:RNA polymerase sigma factor [Ktedonobacterales bacterium]
MRSEVAAPGWTPGDVAGRIAGWFGLASARARDGQRANEAHTQSPRQRVGETAPGGGVSPAPVPASAFEPFFREHERAVYACLWRLTGDAQAARDLTQETFLRAWRHFEQAQSYERPLAWLLRIATNLAFSNYQRESSRRAVSTTALTDADTPSRSDPMRSLAERDLVQRTLLELPSNQRAALVLREVYGFSCEEIGSMLGVSRDAVKMALFRGREGFRRRYLGKVDA